jgi:hypothetical protein
MRLERGAESDRAAALTPLERGVVLRDAKSRDRLNACGQRNDQKVASDPCFCAAPRSLLSQLLVEDVTNQVLFKVRDQIRKGMNSLIVMEDDVSNLIDHLAEGVVCVELA